MNSKINFGIFILAKSLNDEKVSSRGDSLNTTLSATSALNANAPANLLPRNLFRKESRLELDECREETLELWLSPQMPPPRVLCKPPMPSRLVVELESP